jgi:hypothetical protein
MSTTAFRNLSQEDVVAAGGLDNAVRVAVGTDLHLRSGDPVWD